MKQSPTSIPDLAQRCASEMARYRQQQQYDSLPCYELFRLALGHRDEEAWEAIYEQYHRLVRSWLGYEDDDSDALVNQAFARLWQAIPPDHFTDFPTLGKILKYFRRCTTSIAIDAARKKEREQVKRAAIAQIQSVERRSFVERVLDEIVGEQLRERAMECLNSLQERLVFRASFEWNMTPRMIAERWADVFTGAHQVSRIKERIIRRLKRDQVLKRLWENGDGKSTRQSLYM